MRWSRVRRRRLPVVNFDVMIGFDSMKGSMNLSRSEGTSRPLYTWIHFAGNVRNPIQNTIRIESYYSQSKVEDAKYLSQERVICYLSRMIHE